MPKFPDYDCYAELGVSENANKNDIVKAWRELQKTLHPDKQQTEAGKAKATAKSTRLNEAKSILLDPEQREEYDEHRDKQKSGSGGASGGDFFDEPGSFGGFAGATGGGHQSSFSTMNNDDLFDHPGASHNPFGRGTFSKSGSGSSAGTPKAGGATRQGSKSSWTNEAPYVDPRASCNPHTGPTSPLSGSTFQSANAFGGRRKILVLRLDKSSRRFNIRN
ncbi:hypothetical protein KEM55_001330 [Ascosphaera atra]|nr:hypothetical protein KEM55_001330 [Ascosphaera atra]